MTKSLCLRFPRVFCKSTVAALLSVAFVSQGYGATLIPDRGSIITGQMVVLDASVTSTEGALLEEVSKVYAVSLTDSVLSADNTLIVTPGANLFGIYSIYAGIAFSLSSQQSVAQNNRLEVNTLVSADMVGGIADSNSGNAQAVGNTVIYHTDATESATGESPSIYGGRVQKTRSVEESSNDRQHFLVNQNQVFIDSANAAVEFVYGGYVTPNSKALAFELTADQNSVTVDSVRDFHTIYGGYVGTSVNTDASEESLEDIELSASRNTVNVTYTAKSEGDSQRTIAGGWVISPRQGETVNAYADGNRVKAVIEDDSDDSYEIFGGFVMAKSGGDGSLRASGNLVEVSGKGSVAASGAYIVDEFYPHSSIEADGNTLVLNNFTRTTPSMAQVLTGAMIYAAIETAGNITASGNTIVMQQSRSAIGVAGAFVQMHSGNIVSEDNTVFIASSTVDSSVYGSLILLDSQATATVGNNQVIVFDSDIKGVVAPSLVLTTVAPSRAGRGSAFEATGGSLTLGGTNRVGAIGGFDTLVFDVDSAKGTQPILTLTGISGESGSTQTAVSGVTVIVQSQQSLVGKEYYLIASDTGNSDTLTLTDTDLRVQTPFYTLETKIDSLTVQSDSTAQSALSTESPVVQNALKNAVKTVSGNAKTLAETMLGTLAFVQEGAEFIADEGLSAIDSVEGTNAFGAIHGGVSRYLTGSHIDVKGTSLVAGMASKNNALTVGGFVEAGWASSDIDVAGTKTDGNHDYFGLGVAARYRLTPTLYADASLRLGRASTDYDGRYSDSQASYDTFALYTTGHIGLGLEIPVTEKLTTHLYGRYTVSYMDDDELTIKGGSQVKFEVDSTVTHALRLGAKVSAWAGENMRLTAGLAYERVFGGDASTYVDKIAIDEPSLKGDIGILQLGMTVKPTQTDPWSVHFGVKGYVLDKRGVSGNLSATYRF